MDIDNAVSTTTWLAQHISQSVISSSLNHDITSSSPDIDSVLSNGIAKIIILRSWMSIREVLEAEDSSYNDEYLSYDYPLVQEFVGIHVVPKGSSAPEQLALRAIAQGATPTIRESHQATAPQNKQSLRP